LPVRRKQQTTRRLLSVAIAGALLLFGELPAPAQTAVAVGAVVTPGLGTLTMCRNWLVSQSCASYHHIALPELVAIGDRFKIRYGSNPKIYEFHVLQIVHHDERCTILSDAPGSSEAGEHFDIAPCRPAPAAILPPPVVVPVPVVPPPPVEPAR